MDKAKTLPRTKRDKSPSPSSSSFSSLKTATVEKLNSFRGLKKNSPLRKKKKKKDAVDSPAPDTAPLNVTEELPETQTEPSEAASIPTAALDAVKPTQEMLKNPKKAKPPIKKIVKGGKGFLLKFKGKNESAPIMVDATLDVRRSAPKKEETLGDGDQNGAAVAEQLENDDFGAEVTVTSKDEWSTTATCEKVRKLSRLEIQQSVYNEDVDGEGEGEGEGLPDPTTPVDETFADDEGKVMSTSEPGVTVNGHTQPPISIDKKSPSTIKKEILSAVNSAKIRKSSDPISNGSRSNKPRKVSMQARNPSDKNEFLFKILVIGELGTGKTSIIKRYVHQFFSQHYRATIGVDFALKVLPWDSETTIRLQLWDIAGQERFGNMTRVYYKEAVGAFIVFDVTRVSTFEAITKWKQDLDAKVQLPDGEAIPCVLLANKCDQPKEGIVNNSSKMDEFCKENQFVSWFETSAKEDINIDEAANCLVAKIVQNNQKKLEEKEATNGTGVINIDNVGNSEPAKSKFCSAC